MDVVRLCSPLIAAAVVGAVLSAPAVFAKSKDSADRCADVTASVTSQPADACLNTAGSERNMRPQ